MQIQQKYIKNKHQIDDDLCINYIIIKIIIKKIINQNLEYNKNQNKKKHNENETNYNK